MRVSGTLSLLVAAVLSSACRSDFPNPFEGLNPTLPPRPDAEIVFTSSLYEQAGAPREVFAVKSDGAGLSRLTFCNDASAERCDNLEAAPAPDRLRMALRRVTEDTDGDGRLTEADGAALLVVDFDRSIEGRLLKPAARASGIDWSPVGELVVYSAAGEGGSEDLFRADSNGLNTRNLTCQVDAQGRPCANASVRERRPRIDPTGSIAVFERIGDSEKGEVWIFNTTIAQVRVTQGSTPGDALPGTPYRVGSDADPDFSPDNRSIVFRRLTGTGNGGLGTWDVLTVRTDGSGLAVVASGPQFRGAPDWGPKGIVFNEVDVAAGTSSLVVVQPNGSGRTTPVSAGAGFAIDFPRWLP